MKKKSQSDGPYGGPTYSEKVGEINQHLQNHHLKGDKNSLVDADSWFKELNKSEQEAYIKDHPESRYAKGDHKAITAKVIESSQARLVLASSDSTPIQRSTARLVRVGNEYK